ncbi:MAG: T9SS type A sorting domain-containing protein [Ignavibacteria bacterium]|nr:T9SS type A sorting domain-containing protein [Ignavibacteria bacterium]
MKAIIYTLLIFIVLFVLTASNLWAQTVGDYRTGQTSVTWSTAAHWLTYNGSTWNTATVKPDSTNNVYIQRGQTVTLTGNESCKTLHLNKDNSTTALALGTNTLFLYGQIRAYSGSVGTIPGSSSTSPAGHDDWITSTTGKISVVGDSRNLTSAGDWGVGIANVSSPDGFDLEINLNPGQTATLNTFFKCRSFNVVSGTLHMAIDARLAPAQNTRANSNFIIQSGATVISAASGSSTDVVFGYDDDSISDTLWVKTGGKLVLTGATPYIGMNTIIFDGTVEYGRAGNQSTASRANGGAFANVLTNLIISGSGTKTIVNSDFTVNGTFSIQGSATLDNNGANFIYGASSILEYASSTANQTMSTNEFNTSGSRVPPNLVINNTFGTVTLNSNRTTFAGNLTVSAGTFNLSTFTINRSSAGGSLTVSDGATLKIGGTNTMPSNYSTHSIGTSSTIEYGGTAQAIASLNSSQYYGNLTISGSGTKTASTEIRTNGNLNLTAGTLASSTNQVIVYGNVTGTGTHTCTGAGELQIETDGATISGATFGNLKIYSVGGGTITASAAPTITGNLRLTAGTFADGGFTIPVAGNIEGTGSHTGSGKIQMTGSGATISGASLTNLQLNNAGGFSLSGNPTIGGTLTLTSGTLSLGSNTITYSGGSLVRTSGNISASSATLSFMNTSPLTIPASSFSGNIGNLTMNGSGGVTFSNAATITGTLNMQNGILNMGANTLTIGTSASNTGTLTRTNGAIRGTLKRWFAASTTTNSVFPLDNGSNSYVGANISFTGAPSTGGSLTAVYNTSGSGTLPNQGDGNYIPAPELHVNFINLAPQYWTIIAGDGLSGGTYDIDLTANDMNISPTSYQYTGIVKRANSGNPWEWSFSNHITTTSPSAIPTLHGTGFTSFSDFGVAGNTDNLLPVELSSFVSFVNGTNVTLNWSTVHEVNNRGFDIERKSTLSGWQKIGFAEGNGTTQQSSEYSFSDIGLNTGHYNYRLKQIDYNGNFEYHALSGEVVIGIPSRYSLAQNYPNPFNPSTTIIYQLANNGFVSLKVYNMMGREVSTLVNEVKDAGYYSVIFNAKNLSSGMYFYKLTADKFNAVKKMVLIK